MSADLNFILHKTDVFEDRASIKQQFNEFIFSPKLGASAAHNFSMPFYAAKSHPYEQLLHIARAPQKHESSISPPPTSSLSSSTSSVSTSTSASPDGLYTVIPYVVSTPVVHTRRESRRRQLTIQPELMQMKQSKAAIRLGVPPSTFSKRWRESLPDRKWPYRVHKKIEKSLGVMRGLQDKGHNVEDDLRRLIKRREYNTREAVITMYEDVHPEKAGQEEKRDSSGSEDDDDLNDSFEACETAKAQRWSTGSGSQ